MAEQGTPPQDPLQLLANWTGMNLSGRGAELLRFLVHRAAMLGFKSPSHYVSTAIAAGGEEAAALLEQVTVAHSWLFRDAEQLELAIELLQQPMPGMSVEVWVPGCASGEDAFALAMAAEQRGLQVSILATDISPRAIHRATSGRLVGEAMRSLPPEMRRYIVDNGGSLEVDPRVLRNIRFAVHNILGPAPSCLSARGFTLILCRNVLLHFTPEKAQAALARMSAALAPAGTLLLGAAEHGLISPELEHRRFGSRFILQRRGAPAHGVPASPMSQASQNSLSRSSDAVVPIKIAPPKKMPQPEIQHSKDQERLRRAVAELQNGQPERARTTIAELLLRTPISSEVLLLSGIAEHMLSNYEGAASALRGALSADADLWPAELYLALCYAALRNVDEAKHSYERLLRLQKPARRRSSLVIDLLALDTLADDLLMLAKQQLRLLLAKN